MLLWLLLPHARSATDPANRDVPAEVPCPATHLAVVRRPASTEAEHQVQGGLRGDVVVPQETAVFQLLSLVDEPLVVEGDANLVLDAGLDAVDRVPGIHVVQGDRLAC